MKNKILFYCSVGMIMILSFSSGQAISYSHEADSLKKVIMQMHEGNDKIKKADSYYKLIKIYKRDCEWDSALSVIERFLELPITVSDSHRMVRGLFQQGFVLNELNYTEFALSNSRKSLAISKMIQDTLGHIANYNLMGNIYKKMSATDSSAFYFLKALEITELTNDQKNSAVILNNLGDVFLESKHYTTAKEYYKKALEINKKIPGSALSMALNYINLGRYSSARNEYDSAFYYYNRSLGLYSLESDSNGIVDVYNNYGDLYYKKGKYDIAIDYFSKALRRYQNTKNLKGIVTTLGNLAVSNLNKGNAEEAMVLQDSCLNLTHRYGYLDLRMDAYGNFAEAYFKTGDLQKYHHYTKLYDKLKDSIYDISRSKYVYDLNLKYETKKKDADISRLHQETLKRKIQMNFFLYIGLSIILVIIFGALYLRQKAEKEKIIAQNKIKRLEEEKKMMAAKMIVDGQEKERKRIATELHDGLGVLLSATKMQFTAIRDNSPENKPLIEKAIQLLEQASGDVRKISHNMMPGLLTKMGLFEAVEDLFETLNDSDKLQADFELDGEPERLPENKEIMLYRIIQELVNNTLKHAEAKKIKLKIIKETAYIHLVFADDGRGFDVDKILQSNSESFGLQSLQSRINFLNGELIIESKPGEGAIFSMRVPVK